MGKTEPYSTVTIIVQTGIRTKTVVIHKAKDVLFEVDEAFDKGVLNGELTFEAHLDAAGTYYSGSDTVDEEK